MSNDISKACGVPVVPSIRAGPTSRVPLERATHRVERQSTRYSHDSRWKMTVHPRHMCAGAGGGGLRSALVPVFNKLHQSACLVTTRPQILELQMCPAIVAFTWMLGNQAQVPILVQQVLHQPTHLPSPREVTSKCLKAGLPPDLSKPL